MIHVALFMKWNHAYLCDILIQSVNTYCLGQVMDSWRASQPPKINKSPLIVYKDFLFTLWRFQKPSYASHIFTSLLKLQTNSLNILKISYTSSNTENHLYISWFLLFTQYFYSFYYIGVPYYEAASSISSLGSKKSYVL